MAFIVCLDSDYDEAVTYIARWRTDNVYPKLTGGGHTLNILASNLATRAYLSQALMDNQAAYLTASGHGLAEEFTGNDRDAALAVDGYDVTESSGKIIHLLSCNTAFKLGPDLVKNKCIAFFGYDVPFTFHPRYLDEFLLPTAEVDFHIASGKTAQETHHLALAKFDEMILTLSRKGADPSIIGDLMTNRAHFCSPVKDARWGDRNGKI